MIPKYFILDTNILERDKFRFDYGVLKRTKYLIEKGYLKQLSNKIINDEIERHIKDHSSKISKNFKQFKRDSLMVIHSGLDKYQSLDINLKADEIEKEILGLASKFYSDSIDIPLKLADPEEVFQSYNQINPPFAKGEKRKEFPDAFFLSAVNNWAIEKEKQVFIISNDNGVVDYCNDKDNLNSLRGLRELIQETFDEFTVHASHDIFDKLLDNVEDELKVKIDELGVISSVDIDADVSNYEISDIEQIDRYTFDKREDVIIFNCFADVTFDADIMVPDPIFTYFDKEDGERHVLDYLDIEHTQTVRVFYSTRFRFDPENLTDFELLDVKIEEPNLIDLDEIDLSEL